MSFSRAVQPPSVTISAMFRSLRPSSPLWGCTRSLRTFSSYGAAYHSSKRELQTATAYRPHTLTDTFPPQNCGIPDSSIAGDIPELNQTWPSAPAGRPELPKGSGSDMKSSISLLEAQKLTSVAPAPHFTNASASQVSSKPRRSKLRPRKAAMLLTPAAIMRLRQLVSQPDPKMIRVGVKNRGCSGLAYNLEYVEKPGTFDEVVEQDGVKVLVDSKALFSIIGSEMDWQEDKLSSRFVFRNPNIKDQCGCGESFMV